jgi:polyhydroxyalkanoate synthase
MVARVHVRAKPEDALQRSAFETDPQSTTPFEVVAEIGPARLRRYEPEAESAARLPVLFVYSLFKRPYILDLDERRSVVKCFLQRGMRVYMMDWRAPGPGDCRRGLDSYLNEGLVRAVECVCEREQVTKVSLVGICLGGLLSTLAAALHPDSVGHLVPVAAGLERCRMISPVVLEQLVRFYGNLPAWWIHNGVNANLPAAPLLPRYFAGELDEPALAKPGSHGFELLNAKLERWVNSDVPFPGQLALDIMRDAFWDGQLADGRLRVGGERIALKRIRCPVLNISGARDRLVPPENTARLTACVGSSYARNLVFPSTHLGLLAGRAALEELWPRVCAWLKVIE